ncbi:MAG: ATP-dependent DNA helicase RecG [Planctomycetes bacterium]|nr:ATP-dependent DNA helicase RecG [Planctomycetota bacterium]
MLTPRLSSGAGPHKAGTDERLDRPLQFMKGVGPKRAELLDRLMLRTVRDLLFFFPIDHKDRKTVTPLKHMRPGLAVNVRARILDLKTKSFAGRTRVEAKIADETGEFRAGWYSPFVAERLEQTEWAFFSGKVVKTKRGGYELSHPDFEILSRRSDEAEKESDDEAPAAGPASPDFGRIVPVYSLRPKQRRPDGTEPPEVKLNQSFLRRMVWRALEENAQSALPDDLPASVLDARELPALPDAVRQFHFPDALGQRDRARHRLAYEELFLLSAGVALRREQIGQQQAAWKLPLGPTIRKRILARLPFELTEAQDRAFGEIAGDLARARPMNRLLQGDVGCGKTAVAVASMLLAVAHGTQAAMLAPTEVLAEQHLRTLEKLLEGSKVKLGLLRGGASAADRKAFLGGLESGEIHIAIGTHALLEGDVRFKALAMIVVDEQHKFGVEQRQALRAKGTSPHVLVMTATPIPRSLSLTLYGDLDVSVIDALPPGRAEVLTKWLKESDRPKAYKLLIKEARAGHAAYVVLPRIEERSIENGDAPGTFWSEVKGVEAEIKRLKEHLPSLRIEALHGRMKGEEKDRALAKLRGGHLDVLVSTQVIEVGVDLPQATVMLIENAERFGLSSLHQLRGRVGRSGLKGHCLFFAEANTKESKERLKVFEGTRDGFAIAEEDFRLRGPGQFFGTEQSGLPEFQVADLLQDREILAEARADAFALVSADPRLAKPEHAALRARVKQVLGKRLGLVDVG